MMRLAKREKYLVTGAACALVLFCLFQFMVFPFFEQRERLQRGTKVKENELKQIILLSAEYNAHKKNSQGIDQFLSRRKKGFTLFSFLEGEAGNAEVKDRIKYMKPSTSKVTGPYKESMVEMKLEAITMEQLVRYLYRIESLENLITIKRISIKQNKKESGYVDAVMQVLTFQ